MEPSPIELEGDGVLHDEVDGLELPDSDLAAHPPSPAAQANPGDAFEDALRTRINPLRHGVGGPRKSQPDRLEVDPIQASRRQRPVEAADGGLEILIEYDSCQGVDERRDTSGPLTLISPVESHTGDVGTPPGARRDGDVQDLRVCGKPCAHQVHRRRAGHQAAQNSRPESRILPRQTRIGPPCRLPQDALLDVAPEKSVRHAGGNQFASCGDTAQTVDQSDRIHVAMVGSDDVPSRGVGGSVNSRGGVSVKNSGALRLARRRPGRRFPQKRLNARVVDGSARAGAQGAGGVAESCGVRSAGGGA